MHSEEFATEQNQVHVLEPWPAEPSEKAELARVRSGLGSDCNRLTQLPTSPFRSVGGYLNYAEWPDRQRFVELDRAIQISALEKQNTKGGADSDDCPAESHPENVGYIDRLRKESCLTPYSHGHWNGISLASLIAGLEDVLIRRL